MEKKRIVHSSFIRKKWRTIILKMKLLTILIFVGTMALSASTYSQKTKIDLHLQNSSLTEILNSIEKKSEFIFIYNKNVVSSDIRKSISVKDERIDKVLEILLRDIDVSYRIDDRQVFLYKKGELKEPITGMVPTEADQTQKKTISGKVVDNKGEPIPGTTILVKGTTIGVLSGFDGTYSLKVPTDAKVLVFSFVGYKPQEIPVGTKTVFNVTLEEMTVGLEEVVAVGYGVQKKESIVGAITQTNKEELKQTGNVTDLKQALTGKLPGVTTVTSSGEPGGTGIGESATAIYVRGRNTWNGGQPLILVDGVERSMDNLDLNEVESISVLKDASATAVFGVKGANGVILITTKRGTISKPQLSFSYNTTALTASKLPEKMDSYNALLAKNEIIEREVVLNEPSWADYTPEQIVDRYKTPQTTEYARIYPNVNWKEALFKNVSWSHHAALNVQGGTNFIKYFGSLAYLYEGDMFKKYKNNKGYDPNYDYNRFNFRSNMDIKVTGTTNLKVNLAGYYSTKNTNYSYASTTSGTNPQAWSAAYSMPPDVMIVQDTDGRWGASYKLPAEGLTNPVALIYNTGLLQRRTTQLNADFTLEQKLDFITKGLSGQASFFYDNSFTTTGGVTDQNNVRPEAGATTAMIIIDSDKYTGPNQDPREYTTYVPTSSSYLFDWYATPWGIDAENVETASYLGYIPITRRMMYQAQLNYARKFKLHNVGAMGVFKREEYARGSMFKNYREDWVFRTTYDYDSRYFIEMNGAYNGSEQFGPGYRFDFFPSVALGWYVSNEKFFKIDWMNRLKLRYSQGMVGDDSGSSSRWLYSTQYAYGTASRLNSDPNGTSPYTWYKEATVGNSDIHWEKALKKNYGLEMGLLKNMFSINYDYFTEDRTDVLIAGTSRTSIPSYFGATAPTANTGHVKSKGHELEIKFDKRTKNGLHYWTSLAFSHTTNEVIAKEDPELYDDYQKAAGFAIGQTKTQVSTGFYNNWDQVFASVQQETNDNAKLPGYYNILDYNGDGVINSNDNVPYGYSEVPENTYNLSLGVDYKGFSAMVQFYGVNNVSRYIPFDNFYSYQDVVFSTVSDYWSKTNTGATSFLPRWKTQGEFIGNYYIYDGSFLRLKTAEIAYTFKDAFVRKIGLSSLRVYLNGNNLFFWSDLPDDREAATSGGGAAAGSYPTSRRFNLGVDLTF
jgi:TonB-linked SusC/RagA family outer membrane protein